MPFYTTSLKPFVFNANDLSFILAQINFRPLFDAQGNAIINWDGQGAIYDGRGNLIWNGYGDIVNAQGVTLWDNVDGDNVLTPAEMTAAAAAATANWGSSYSATTSLAGLRDVSGLNNNLTLLNSTYGSVDQPFLRTVASDYAMDGHGHVYIAGEADYLSGVDQNGADVFGSSFWANKEFAGAWGGLNGFASNTNTIGEVNITVGSRTYTADYTVSDNNHNGVFDAGDQMDNIVDYSPRMISRLTTTGGVEFVLDSNGNIDYSNGVATVATWGLLGDLGIQDAQTRFAGTPGEGEYFVGAQNPGVSPTNGWFTIFGQFFDHGLDFIDKGQQGKSIKIIFAADDPLYGQAGADGQPATSITIARASVAGFDANGNPEYVNHTSPFIDQSQTYGSHADVTLLLREWVLDPVTGTFKAGMNLFNGDTLATAWSKPDGTLTTETLPTLNELRAHVVETGRTDLTWEDVFDYHGSGQALILDFNPRFDDAHLLKGDGVQDTAVADALATLNLEFDGSGMLHVIGSGSPGVTGVNALIATGFVNPSNFSITAPPGAEHDAVSTLLMASVGDHYIAGDGRVNENFGLTTVHHVFHEEHNFQIDNLINAIMKESDARVGRMGDGTYDQDYMKQFQVSDGPGVTWNATTGNYEKAGQIAWNLETMFNAAKLTVEMEYQHVAIDQYARTVTPDIKEFVGYTSGENPSVSLEYAQSIFRFGHSQLRETIDTIDPTHGLTGKITGYALKLAFLNPDEFANLGPAAIALGMTHQQGNEIDEFITPALNQGLLGLPLDLAAINLARGRDVGIPALNEFRTAVGLQAYTGWADFGANMIHPENLVNFIAAYSFDGNADKAQAVMALYNGDYSQYGGDGNNAAAALGLDPNDLASAEDFAFNFMNGGDKGIDAVDTWLGGLAEVHVTGGLLGETFNLVFVDQMERIQDGDRFYYLYRLVNQQFADEVGGGQFKDIIERNTGLTHLGGSAFSYNDQYYDLAGKREVFNSAGAGPETNTVNNNHKYGDVVDQDGNAVTFGVEANRFGAVNGVGALTLNPTRGVFSDGGNSQSRDGQVISVRVTDPLTGIITTKQFIRDTRVIDPNAPNGGLGIDGTPNSGAESTEVIVGTNRDDFIQARGGDDTVYGDGGNDIIFGGNGIDRLYGGDGKDQLFGGDGAELSDGGAGDDYITGDSSATAAAGTDQLIGGMGNDYISGGVGIDKLAGGGGDDVIYGEGDTDPFTHGGDGNDYIDGGISGDLLYGDNGDDVLVGAADQDILYGGNGDDILRPGNPSQAIGGGPDEVLGGDGITDTGFDIIDFSDNNASAIGVTFDLTNQANPNVQIDGTTPVPTAAQVEGIVGSTNDDTLTGDNDVESAASTWLIGGTGSDKLQGGLGNDVIVGGSIRLDQMIGKFNTAYNHNNNNDNANATGLTDINANGVAFTYTQEQMDYLYDGASHRVAWDDTLDNTGLLDAANAQLGGVDYEKHFTEMLRTEKFKNMMLGDGGTDAGKTDTLVLTGNSNDYVIEQVTFAGHNVLRITGTGPQADQGSDLVADVENFQFTNGTFSFAQMVNKPNVALGSATVTEGNAGTVNAAFVVTLSQVFAQAVTVQYATANGVGPNGAQAGADYVGATGTVTIPAGQLSATVNVVVNGDTLFENNETFSVTLSNPVNANITGATGTGTITNDDSAPTVSIAAVSQNEGNAGNTAMTFTVSLSAATGADTTVHWATSDGSATAGTDYAAASGDLTIEAGATTRTVTVNATGDVAFENNETFNVTLTAPTNATLGTAAATGTIVNDDAAPVLSINSITAAEGNSGTTAFTFTVTKTGATDLPATVDWTTGGGTATAGNDYAAASGTLSFAANETTKTVTILVSGDTAIEAAETFNVTLSAPTNATLGTAVGVGTITNDDIATPPSDIQWNANVPADGTSGSGPLLTGLPLAGATLATLATTDASAGTIGYALAAGSSAGFAVNAATGVVTRTGSAMTENQTYTLNVIATNATTGMARTETFTIKTGSNSVVVLGGGNDILTSGGNDTILYGSGSAGTDRLTGGAGNDSLFGQAGTDNLTGGAGNDRIDGGAGSDVANFAGTLQNFNFDSLGTTIQVADKVGTEGTDTISGVETLNVAGAAYAVVAGTAGVNNLTGTAGSQALFGFGGNDAINAGAGNDIVSGGDGDDTITYDVGATANGGRDLVFGGAGNDTFVLNGNATNETFRIYSRDAFLAANPGAAISADTGIVVTRNGTAVGNIVAELNSIEEIKVNTTASPNVGVLANGNSYTGPVSADNIQVIGNFVGTGLAYNTITVDGAGSTVDITGLTSDHRVVLNTNGGTGSIIGGVRPQDVVNGIAGAEANVAIAGFAGVSDSFAFSGLSPARSGGNLSNFDMLNLLDQYRGASHDVGSTKKAMAFNLHNDWLGDDDMFHFNHHDHDQWLR